jgi:hypothetical protein
MCSTHVTLTPSPHSSFAPAAAHVLPPPEEGGVGPEDVLEAVLPPPRTDPRDQDVLEALQKTRSVREVLEEELQQLGSLPPGAFTQDQEQEGDQDLNHHHYQQQQQQNQQRQLRPDFSGGDISISAMTTPTGSAPSSASEMPYQLPGSCSGDMSGNPGSPARGVSLSGGSYTQRTYGGGGAYTSLPVPVTPHAATAHPVPTLAVQSDGGAAVAPGGGTGKVGAAAARSRVDEWAGAGLALHGIIGGSTGTLPPASGGEGGYSAVGGLETAFLGAPPTSSTGGTVAVQPPPAAAVPSEEVAYGRTNSGAKTVVSLERGIAGSAAMERGGGVGGGAWPVEAATSDSAFAMEEDLGGGGSFNMQPGVVTNAQVRKRGAWGSG